MDNTPDWLVGLVDAVAACIEAMMPEMADKELRWRLFYDSEGFGCWQAHIFPAPLETLSGERRWCGGLVVHVDDIADLFDHKPEIKFSVDRDEFFFADSFQQHEVVVIVYTAPPKDEETIGILLEDGSVRWLDEQTSSETN